MKTMWGTVKYYSISLIPPLTLAFFIWIGAESINVTEYTNPFFLTEPRSGALISFGFWENLIFAAYVFGILLLPSVIFTIPILRWLPLLR